MPRSRIEDLNAYPHGFLSVTAFAQYLNVTNKQIRKWIRAGVLPAYCFHGLWRIAKTDAVAFVEREWLQS